MATTEEKLLAVLASQPEVEHEVFVESLDHNEQVRLLDTVRDMQNRGLIRRDLSEKRDGRRVLKYARPNGV